jgi:hypothetical protein
MESDKVPILLKELRQLVDRWELELGAKPVWWRRYRATNGAREKSEIISAPSRHAPAKSRNGAKRLNSKNIDAPRRAAGAVADAPRAAGK